MPLSSTQMRTFAPPLLQRNTDIAAGMPVLDTIVDQIDKETGEKLGISLHDRGQHEILHIHTDLLFFGFFQQLIRGGFRYDLQIYLLKGGMKPAAFGPGNINSRIPDGTSAALFPECRQTPAGPRGKRKLRQSILRMGEDDRYRGAQFMGCVGRKLLFPEKLLLQMIQHFIEGFQTDWRIHFFPQRQEAAGKGLRSR